MNLRRFFLCIIFAISYLMLSAQGVVIYKKDNRNIKVPYEEMDSIASQYNDNAQNIVVYKKNGTNIIVPYDQLDNIAAYDYDDNPNINNQYLDNLTFTVGNISFTMIPVQAGTFQMGDDIGASKKRHNVTISKDFYIGETEVTQALWKAVTGYTPTSDGSKWDSNGLGDNKPAYYISYNDVQKFITKLNSLTGISFRMPTEAEWEYAARGGNISNGYKYSGSNKIDEVAWYKDYYGGKTKDVKTKAPNELGIYDMTGNVSEWCSDWYNSSYYSSSPSIDPTGPSTGSERVLRGGSWDSRYSECYTTDRKGVAPTSRGSGIGVRLALDSSQKQ